MSLSDSWQSFLDACAEKGLPFRDWAYALEDKGVPSLPVFVVALALIVGLLAVVVAPALSIPIGAPQKGRLQVSISMASGEQIGGEPVVRVKNVKTGETAEQKALNGVALFSDLAAGEYEVTVVSDALLIAENRQSKTVEAGKTASLMFEAESATAELVSLYVTIRGADSAAIDVAYESGVPVDAASGASHEFRVPKNKNYVVTASAEGYSPVSKTVVVGSQNEQVALTLVKEGEEREAELHVGVFDESGIEGAPIANATVKILEANALKTFFTLRTAQDGSCEAVKVPLGASLSVIASAPGFEPKTQGVNASEETVFVKIQLKRAAAAENTTIEVVDEAGAAVSAPLVRVFDSRNNVRLENAPADGVLQLNPPALGGFAGLYATVYKPGFLPEVVYSIRRGANRVTLREATKQNSGDVRVVVSDKNGLPAAQAAVNLFDSAKRLLGFPGGVTGEDGTLVFEGVPASGVIAAASKAGRRAESALAQVPEGGEVEVSVQFAAAKTRFEALVTDAVSRKPVSGATVKLNAGSSASCTTAGNGKCGFEIVESDAASALVTAPGYEDFQSDEFALTPGAKNKREFALTPVKALEGKISFIGVFDENGKKASELKPLGVYTARFSLQGSETQRAIAHVRVGDAAKSLDEEPIQIVSYSAGGAQATRGVSYDEIIAQQEGLQKQAAQTAKQSATAGGVSAGANDVVVGIYDYGFVPADVLAVEGGRVTFKNLGETPHTVVFDQGFEGGAGSTSNVLQPNQTFVIKPPRSGSWSFRCGIHPQEMGTLNVVPPTQRQQIEVQKASTKTLSGAEATAFKWVEFAFEPFKGRKEVSVRFKARQRVGEKAWLEYRAAFYGEAAGAAGGAGGAGGEQTVLRAPEDAAAGASKPEALADAFKTPKLAIKFGGVCDNGVCLDYWFEQNGVREREAFTAELGKTFRLGFHVLKENEVVGGTATLRLKTPASPAAGGALVLKQASLGKKTVAAPSAGESNATELSIVLREADVDSQGFFEIEARRLSNDAALQLAALDSKRATLVEENVFVRVAAQGTPSLHVSVKPQFLAALQESSLAFTIKNAFETPLADCRVFVEPAGESSEIIAFALEADENSQSAQRGEYKVSGIKPAGMGALAWRATCEGYAPASGTIAVKPPEEAITVAPDAVRLALRDKDSAEAKIRVQNKVSNELRISFSVEFSGKHDYSLVAVSPETLQLKGLETKEVTVTASLSPDTPFISNSVDKLTEKASGAVHVVASTGDASGFGAAGTYGETRDVQFQVDLSVSQKKIDDLWGLNPQSVALDLQAPSSIDALTAAAEFASAELEVKSVTVENRGDYPLLINQQVDVEGVVVEPASAVLEPHESGEFLVSAQLPDSLLDCLMQDDKLEGAITFYASSLGVSSQKAVALKKTVKASEYCEPKNAVSLTLPLPITLELPAGAGGAGGAAVKQNSDGSQIVVLQGGEMLWFDAGASTDSRSVTLPLNTKMKVGKNRALITQQGVTLSLPLQTIVEIPDDADVAQQGAELVVSAGNALLYLPAGVGLTIYETKRSAIVPPNSPMRFERAPIADILNMLPANGISLNLPVEETLVLPPNSRILAQSGTSTSLPLFGSSGSAYSGYASLSRYQNVNAVVLPDGLRIAFGGDARVERTPAAVIITVPAKSQLVVPPFFVHPISAAGATGAGGAGGTKGQSATGVGLLQNTAYGAVYGDVYDAFYLTLPFLSLPGIPTDARFIPDKKKSLYSYRLADESVVQFKFDPRTVSTSSGSVTQVRVSSMQPVYFLKGAAAEAVEDPTAVCAVPEILAPNEDVLVEFPAGTTLKKGSVTATLRGCSSDSKIRVYSAKNSDFVVYESPASKRVVVEGGKLSKDGADVESQQTVESPSGKKIKFVYCEKDDDGRKISDELKLASIKFKGSVALVLPPGATPKGGLTEITFNGYQKIKVTQETGGDFELGPTNKIAIEFGFAEGTIEAGKQKEAIEKGETNKVFLPPESVVKYVPYCNKASSGTLEVKTGMAPLAFEPPQLEFVLTNAQMIDLKSTVIKNLGLEKVTIDSLSVDAESGSELLPEALPADPEHMHFSQKAKGKYGGTHTGDIPGGAKDAEYEFVAEAPASILDELGCIPKDKKLELKGKVLFHTTSESGYEQEPAQLPVTVKIDGSDHDEKCAAAELELQKKGDENVRNLLEVGFAEVNPSSPTVYFKGVNGKQGNHKQFLTLKNNHDEEIKVTVLQNADNVECATAKEKKALNAFVLPSGTAALFECVSTAAGEKELKLNFTSTKSKWYQDPVYVVKFKVFEPEAAVAHLYSSSPMGAVLVTEKTLAATQNAQTQAQVQAPSKVEFADFSSCELNALSFDSNAPSTATSGTAFSACETSFCTEADAGDAIGAFIDSAAKIAMEQTKDDKSYERIRAMLGASPPLPWKKTMALHLTNSLLRTKNLVESIDKKVQERDAALKTQGFGGGVTLAEADLAKFKEAPAKGCGIYLITAQLNAGGFGGVASPKKYEDRVKDYALQLTVEKLEGCEETMANLPLLMPPTDADYYGGASDKKTGLLKAIVDKRAVVGAYDGLLDEFDAGQAGALSKAFYRRIEVGRKDAQGKIVGVKPPEYYGNINECNKNLAVAFAFVKTATVLGCVGAVVGAIFIPGASPFLGRLAWSLCSANLNNLAACLPAHAGLGAVIPFTGGSFKDCNDLSYCLHIELANLGEALAEGAVGGAGALKAAKAATQAATKQVADAATGVAAKTAARDAARAALTEAKETAFKTGTQTVREVEENIAKLGKDLGSAETALTEAGGTQRIAGQALQQATGRSFQKATGFKNAGQAVGLMVADAVLYGVTSYAFTFLNRGETANPTWVYAVGKLVRVAAGAAAYKKLGWGALAAAKATSDAAKASFLSKTAGGLLGPNALASLAGGAGGVAGLLVGSLLSGARVEGKPVRSEFDFAFASHMLAFHYKDKNKPTTVEYCYLTSYEKKPDGQSKDCIEEMELKNVNDVCPSKPSGGAATACLVVKRSPDIPNSPAQQAGITGYTVVLMIPPGEKNKGEFGTAQVLNSIFQPDAAPADTKMVGGFVTSKEILSADAIGAPLGGKKTAKTQAATTPAATTPSGTGAAGTKP